MDRDTNKEGLRFPLRYNLIGIDCNSWGLSRSPSHTLALFDMLAFLKGEHNTLRHIFEQNDTKRNQEGGSQTCLDWVKSSTRWPWRNHRRSRDSTTISFPERFQKPKWSSWASWSSGTPLRNWGPPEKRSGWLQILRRAIRPGKTWVRKGNTTAASVKTSAGDTTRMRRWKFYVVAPLNK